jgi:hypothetical protein
MAKHCKIDRKRIKGKLVRKWRCRWRENGKRCQTPWTNDLAIAEADKVIVDARLAAKAPLAGRTTLPWSEVQAKWLAGKAGRYQEEAKRALDRHCAAWTSTASATPTALATFPIGPSRYVKACLRWAKSDLKQGIDFDALDVKPKRIRPLKPKPPLMADADSFAFVEEAARWSQGNGAIAHMGAWYGHRAESLVKLTGDAFDGTHITLPVKGGGFVRHMLLPDSIAILNALKPRAGEPLFLNHLGVPWKTGQAFCVWMGHCLGAGYHQALKRPAISRQLAAGSDAKTIASITGHKTPSILLNTYAATNEDRQMKAIAALGKILAPNGPKLVPNKAISPCHN